MRNLSNKRSKVRFYIIDKNYPDGIYMLKVNNRNTRLSLEVCSNLGIKTQNDVFGRSGVFIFNFEHISHFALVFLLLILNMLLRYAGIALSRSLS